MLLRAAECKKVAAEIANLLDVKKMHAKKGCAKIFYQSSSSSSSSHSQSSSSTMSFTSFNL
jgi:hypothetical protein